MKQHNACTCLSRFTGHRLTGILYIPDTFRGSTPDGYFGTRYTGNSGISTTYTPATFRLKSGEACQKFPDFAWIRIFKL